MEFLPKEIEEYSLSHTSYQSRILEKIENDDDVQNVYHTMS